MLKYIRILLCLFLVSYLIIGCKTKEKPEKDKSENTLAKEPTEDEKVTAVKDMLKQGVSKAVGTLKTENGFLNKDSLIVSLPEDIKGLLDNINKIPQGDKLIDNAMSQINKVAEISAEPIGNIINAAIDSMSIDDVNHLLLSDSAAATHYLQKIIRTPLHTACEPIIVQSLDKKIVGNITPRDTWITIAENYNKVAGTKIGQITRLQAVETELDEIITDRILDAVFYLIAKEEMNVKKHPAARISKSVARSFGWIDREKN